MKKWCSKWILLQDSMRRSTQILATGGKTHPHPPASMDDPLQQSISRPLSARKQPRPFSILEPRSCITAFWRCGFECVLRITRNPWPTTQQNNNDDTGIFFYLSELNTAQHHSEQCKEEIKKIWDMRTEKRQPFQHFDLVAETDCVHGPAGRFVRAEITFCLTSCKVHQF